MYVGIIDNHSGVCKRVVSKRAVSADVSPLGPPLVIWDSAKVSHKRVFAPLTPEIHSYEMAQVLQKPVFALPGCQRTSVNTLLCDTLALADDFHQELQFGLKTSRGYNPLIEGFFALQTGFACSAR